MLRKSSVNGTKFCTSIRFNGDRDAGGDFHSQDRHVLWAPTAPLSMYFAARRCQFCPDKSSLPGQSCSAGNLSLVIWVTGSGRVLAFLTEPVQPSSPAQLSRR